MAESCFGVGSDNIGGRTGGISKTKDSFGKNRIMVADEVEVTPTAILGKGIKFGVMADVHMDWKGWAKFLEISKNREEEFVIIAGDMTSLGKEKELIAAKKVLDQAQIRYYVVPGNHDLWQSTKSKQPLFNAVFGQDYQSFKEGGVKFILINNGSASGLGEVQRMWLDNEVKECRVIYCLAVMHMPLNHTFSAHVMGEGSTLVSNEAAELITLLRDNGVTDLITGHLHYSTSYGMDGLRTNIVGAVSSDRNNQTPRYTEFVAVNKTLERLVIEGEIDDIGN